jgi:hypothetical protein
MPVAKKQTNPMDIDADKPTQSQLDASCGPGVINMFPKCLIVPLPKFNKHAWRASRDCPPQ